jgi:hypothetical protein
MTNTKTPNTEHSAISRNDQQLSEGSPESLPLVRPETARIESDQWPIIGGLDGRKGCAVANIDDRWTTPNANGERVPNKRHG